MPKKWNSNVKLTENKDLNKKAKIIQLVGKKNDIAFGNDFLDMTSNI